MIQAQFILKELEDYKMILMPDQQIDRLYLVWNTGNPVSISFDDFKFDLAKNCILFISEFHQVVTGKFENVRIIEFNKAFLGIDNSLNQSGDYLLVYYGYHFLDNIPKIKLNLEEAKLFEDVWKNMLTEYSNLKDPVSLNLTRNSFQRMMLLAQKIHEPAEFDIPIDYMNLRTIRAFQYLVETNFRDLIKVSEYAEIMRESPKRLSELFKKYYNQKPSELIAFRRNLFAQKRLKFTDEYVKNIAYDLNFSDSQAFSHFFKKMNGMTPETYRKKFMFQTVGTSN